MKKLSRPWFLCFLCLAACATKPIDHAPPITPAVLGQTQASETTLQRGRALYLAHCGRCHAYMLPENIRREDWHVVVPGMAWNAGLNASEERAVREYILAVTP
jgi:hypothetical protein